MLTRTLQRIKWKYKGMQNAVTRFQFHGWSPLLFLDEFDIMISYSSLKFLGLRNATTSSASEANNTLQRNQEEALAAILFQKLIISSHQCQSKLWSEDHSDHQKKP